MGRCGKRPSAVLGNRPSQRGEVKSVLSFAKPCDHPIYDFIVRDIENSSSIPSFSLMHLAGHFPLASTLRVSVKAMGVGRLCVYFSHGFRIAHELKCLFSRCVRLDRSAITDAACKIRFAAEFASNLSLGGFDHQSTFSCLTV